MASIPAQWLHPVRYRQHNPVAAHVLHAMVSSMGADMPTPDDMTECQRVIVREYNRATQAVPPNPLHNPMQIVKDELALATRVANFTACGRQIFAVPASLMQELEDTDLGDVRLGDVRYPFSTFYVAFGDAFDGALPGRANQIDGAYVTVRDAVDHGPAGPMRGLAVTLTARPRPDAAFPDSAWLLTHTPTVTLQLPLDRAEPAAVTLSEYLAARRARLLAHKPSLPGPLTLADGTTVAPAKVPNDLLEAQFLADAEDAVQRALALVVHSLLYLTARPDDTTPAYPSDTPAALVSALQAAQTPKGRQRSRTAMLAGGYWPLRQMRPLQTPADDALDAGNPVSAMSPHFRRAHWRRQPVGPGRLEIRVLWVRATLVRPDRGLPAQGRLRTPPRR